MFSIFSVVPLVQAQEMDSEPAIYLNRYIIWHVFTVERLFKTTPLAIKCCLSRLVIFGGKFNFIEM